MKNVLFFTMLLFGLNSLQAQITKRNWLVGGEAGFISSQVESSSGESSGISIFVRPNIGYFFVDKLAGGLLLSFGHNKIKDGESSTGYGVGPFLRYYFLEEEKRVNILAHVNYAYGTSSATADSNSFGIKAGPVIFFNSSVALEMLIGYNYTKFDDNKFSDIQLGIGFQIHLQK